MNVNYDKKAKPVTLRPGEKVFLRRERHKTGSELNSSKLKRYDGPFTVIKVSPQDNPKNAIIRRQGPGLSKDMKVSIDRLKKCPIGGGDPHRVFSCHIKFRY